jgi:hypothetical protein
MKRGSGKIKSSPLINTDETDPKSQEPSLLQYPLSQNLLLLANR